MSSIPELRLFGRIVVLVFLLGLVFTPVTLFIGIRIYYFTQPHLSSISSPNFDWPLNALEILLDGAFLVLFLTLTDLGVQFIKGSRWKNGHSIFLRFCGYYTRGLGFLLIGTGVYLLLDGSLHFTEGKMLPIQKNVFEILLILLFILGPVFFSWYLIVRDKRRLTQREQDGLIQQPESRR